MKRCAVPAPVLVLSARQRRPEKQDGLSLWGRALFQPRCSAVSAARPSGCLPHVWGASRAGVAGLAVDARRPLPAVRACACAHACTRVRVCVWGVGAPTRSPAPKHALSALPPSECPDLKSHATSVSGLKPRGSFSALVLGSSSQSSLQPHKDPQQDPCFRRPWCRGPPRAEPRVLLSRS